MIWEEMKNLGFLGGGWSPMAWSSSYAALTTGESYQWNSEMAPIPGELVHWLHKETHSNKKKAKYTIPGLLLSIIAETKVKESARLGLNAK